jgi:hypothetical protein
MLKPRTLERVREAGLKVLRLLPRMKEGPDGRGIHSAYKVKADGEYSYFAGWAAINRGRFACDDFGAKVLFMQFMGEKYLLAAKSCKIKTFDDQAELIKTSSNVSGFTFELVSSDDKFMWKSPGVVEISVFAGDMLSGRLARELRRAVSKVRATERKLTKRVRHNVHNEGRLRMLAEQAEAKEERRLSRILGRIT